MNKIILSGTVTTDPIISHEVSGEKFYAFDISSKRTSANVDSLKCIVSELFIDDITVGKQVKAEGEVRTRNEQGHLNVYVFILKTLPYSERDENIVWLTGRICKKNPCRKTPLGRQITDIIVASNRPTCKSDYIPCVTWGRYALRLDCAEVGDLISIKGRLQSREYIKELDDKTKELKVTYEISAATIRIGEQEDL